MEFYDFLRAKAEKSERIYDFFSFFMLIIMITSCTAKTIAQIPASHLFPMKKKVTANKRHINAQIFLLLNVSICFTPKYFFLFIITYYDFLRSAGHSPSICKILFHTTMIFLRKSTIYKMSGCICRFLVKSRNFIEHSFYKLITYL